MSVRPPLPRREVLERRLSRLGLCFVLPGVLLSMCACFGLIQLASAVTVGVAEESAAPVREALPVVALSFAVGLIAVGFLVAGRALMTGRRPGLCVGMSVAALTVFPIGTVLGIVTLAVLADPEVRGVFEWRGVEG